MAPERTKRNRAARNGNPNGLKDVAPAEPPMVSGIFVNSAGLSFHIQGISPFALETIPKQLEEEWTAAGKKLPKRPTYITKTVGGNEEVHEHDEKSLETKEEKKAWAEYLVDQAAFDHELQERMLTNILLDGVAAPEIDPKWVERQKFMGRRVPTNEFELEIFWKKTQVIRSTEDAQGLMTSVLALTGVSEEAIRVAEDSFRSTVEKSNGHKARKPPAGER